MVPNLHYGALRPWDAPLRKIFTPENEYLTLPNCSLCKISTFQL